MTRTRFISRLAGIAAAGFLVRLCLPSGPWSWLPFVALVPFALALRSVTGPVVGLGAQAFANVSNDAWFMSARAAELHLSLAVFRAVEQRRPLVRGTNSGFGAHIKATGEIVPGSLTPMNERAIRQATLHLPGEITI